MANVRAVSAARIVKVAVATSSIQISPLFLVCLWAGAAFLYESELYINGTTVFTENVAGFIAGDKRVLTHVFPSRTSLRIFQEEPALRLLNEMPIFRGLFSRVHRDPSARLLVEIYPNDLGTSSMISR